ncbi:hypothetical protein bcere0019_52180 [Bacillus cereus Rock3-28]|nr:hypothetical protein bcere0019_52180 [Bacillus cereus Rock3-28]
MISLTVIFFQYSLFLIKSLLLVIPPPQKTAKAKNLDGGRRK